MRQLGERARAWIDASLDEFAIAVESEGVLSPAKRHGELAMVAGLVLDRGDNAHARSWLDLAWNRFEGGALLEREIAIQPANAAVYPAFRRHGFRTDGLDHAIASLWNRIEDPTLRLLLACSVAGTELAAPFQLDQLLDDSIVGREPATWQVDERSAYVITHVVLFLAPTSSLPQRHLRYIARALPVWIARFAFAGYLDLVGEMVMVAHILGECVPETEWQVLVDAQEPDGLMPFRAAWRGREVAPRLRFIANYHSTLTAYAAAAMCTH